MHQGLRLRAQEVGAENYALRQTIAQQSAELDQLRADNVAPLSAPHLAAVRLQSALGKALLRLKVRRLSQALDDAEMEAWQLAGARQDVAEQLSAVLQELRLVAHEREELGAAVALAHVGLQEVQAAAVAEAEDAKFRMTAAIGALQKEHQAEIRRTVASGEEVVGALQAKLGALAAEHTVIQAARSSAAAEVKAAKTGRWNLEANLERALSGSADAVSRAEAAEERAKEAELARRYAEEDDEASRVSEARATKETLGAVGACRLAEVAAEASRVSAEVAEAAESSALAQERMASEREAVAVEAARAARELLDSEVRSGAEREKGHAATLATLLSEGDAQLTDLRAEVVAANARTQAAEAETQAAREREAQAQGIAEATVEARLASREEERRERVAVEVELHAEIGELQQELKGLRDGAAAREAEVKTALAKAVRWQAAACHLANQQQP